jgi:hypothetical protein
MLSDLAGAVVHVVVAFVREALVGFRPVQHWSRCIAHLHAGPISARRAERDSQWIVAAGVVVVVLTGIALALYNNLFALV